MTSAHGRLNGGTGYFWCQCVHLYGEDNIHQESRCGTALGCAWVFREEGGGVHSAEP